LQAEACAVTLEMDLPIRRYLLPAFAWAIAAACPAMSEPAVRGLDHIPLAVNDLERSMSDFAALGFAIKPGRPHANGLRNAHVKFPDGTEIELITAPAATDALTSQYRDWLKGGDGPALLGLFTPDFNALVERLSRLGVVLDRKDDFAAVSEPASLHRLFFSRRQHSPTDRPEHFAHANTALGLAGAWLAGATAEQRLLAQLGAVSTEGASCGPFGSDLATFSLAEGQIVFLPETAQSVSGRSIVGATVKVKSLETARTILDAKRIRYNRIAGCARESLWIGPAEAHGMWLEFRQPPGSR
jgi:hypothetical protein